MWRTVDDLIGGEAGRSLAISALVILIVCVT